MKAKGSVGGIDGVSIDAFEKEKRKQILKLAEELRAGTWKPQPYLEIEVAKTKNPEEMRKLGMTTVHVHRFFVTGNVVEACRLDGYDNRLTSSPGLSGMSVVEACRLDGYDN